MTQTLADWLLRSSDPKEQECLKGELARFGRNTPGRIAGDTMWSLLRAVSPKRYKMALLTPIARTRSPSESVIPRLPRTISEIRVTGTSTTCERLAGLRRDLGRRRDRAEAAADPNGQD